MLARHQRTFLAIPSWRALTSSRTFPRAPLLPACFPLISSNCARSSARRLPAGVSLAGPSPERMERTLFCAVQKRGEERMSKWFEKSHICRGTEGLTSSAWTFSICFWISSIWARLCSGSGFPPPSLAISTAGFSASSPVAAAGASVAALEAVPLALELLLPLSPLAPVSSTAAAALPFCFFSGAMIRGGSIRRV